MEDRKIIREKKLRAQKIKEALAKKPTTPYMNRYGMTPTEIQQTLHQSRVAGASKKEVERKILSLKEKNIRPNKAPRTNKENPNLQILLDVPNVSNKLSIEYPTPNWFRFDEKADVSIVIPLYKSATVIKELIDSWDLENNGLKVEIIFVEDHCPQSTKDKVIRFWENRKSELNGIKIGRIYYNPSNLGFGCTCNIGAENATGDYVIFLNADTVVTKGWIKPMIDLFKDEEVGIVGNLQLKQGGEWDGFIDSAGSEWDWGAQSFEHIGRHSYNHQRIPRPIHPDNCPDDLKIVAEREMVTGCCVACKRDAFLELGGFNPNYRIGYWEDSELSLTFREKGYKVMFQPNSVIYHKLGHTNSGPHQHQNHNRNYFFNKWVHSGRIDSLVSAKRDFIPEIRTILIRRSEARGDVLAASAVAAALKKKHNCKILFNTHCDDVLDGNPYIDKIITSSSVSDRVFQVYYNLDLVYEYRPRTNILKAYADAVGVDVKDCEMFLETKHVHNLPSKYVVIHSGKTAWEGRNWDIKKFEELAHRIKQKNYQIICIGGIGDHQVPCDLDLRGKTDIKELAYVIKNASVFIGIDSFPMHIAQAVNTPGICFFGAILPETRIINSNMIGVNAKELNCLGCHHRKPAPCVVTNSCETGTLDCIKQVSVDQMWNEIKNRLEK